MSKKTQSIAPEVIMSREGSSMASTWEEHLCLSRIGNRWLLGEYGYNWVANIYDLPENKQRSEDEQLYIPEEWNGHKVLGVADGEYIATDELVSSGNYIEFDAESVDKAIEFANQFDWGNCAGFHEAMAKLKLLISNWRSGNPN